MTLWTTVLLASGLAFVLKFLGYVVPHQVLDGACGGPDLHRARWRSDGGRPGSRPGRSSHSPPPPSPLPDRGDPRRSHSSHPESPGLGLTANLGTVRPVNPQTWGPCTPRALKLRDRALHRPHLVND
jgi:hypothetical protein